MWHLVEIYILIFSANIVMKRGDLKVARIILHRENIKIIHETSFPTTSAPGSNHRKVMLRRVPRSIHVPSEVRIDEDASEKFVSGVEVTCSVLVGKET